MNIVLSLVAQFYNTAQDMHHTFDAPAGFILICIRVLVGLSFLVSVLVTYQSSRYRVRQFLIKFGVLGFFYLCSMPIVVFLANKMMAHNRN